MEYEIEIYQGEHDNPPFTFWLDRIQDKKARATILMRLSRLRLGNLGDSKSVGSSIYELRIHYGPGLRIYYSKVGTKIVLLLCGGSKKSQVKDIARAKSYLKDYNLNKEISYEKIRSI